MPRGAASLTSAVPALAAKFEAVRESEVEQGRIPPHRLLVPDTGIRVHEWWAKTWEQVASGP